MPENGNKAVKQAPALAELTLAGRPTTQRKEYGGWWTCWKAQQAGQEGKGQEGRWRLVREGPPAGMCPWT